MAWRERLLGALAPIVAKKVLAAALGGLLTGLVAAGLLDPVELAKLCGS